MHRIGLLRLSAGAVVALYLALYVLVTVGIHLVFFPIGDIGVEADFYSELVVAAKRLAVGDFSIAHYPYKGPVYSFALIFVHLFGGDWYLSGILLNALCAAGSLLVIYRLILRLYDRVIALLTIVFVSLVYEFFVLSHKASSDMLFLFLCYVAIYMLCMERFSWMRLILGGLFSALAFLTRYNGIFLPVALLVMLLIHPGAWSKRRRFAAAAVYMFVFFAVCAPWFIKNMQESGRLLATRNVENVAREFYREDMGRNARSGGFTSIWQIFAHDPVRFVKHYGLNIARHFWVDMYNLLGFEAGILVIFGIVRLFFVRPSRMQWAYFAFPFSYYLFMCVVFLLPRFSLLLAPMYYVILLSLLLDSRGLMKLASGGSGTGSKIIGRFDLIRVVTAFIIIVLIFFQIQRIVAIERVYYERRPLYIIQAGQFLSEYDARIGRSEQAIVMARKAHIAYYSDMTYQQYPQSISSIPDLIATARDRGVAYLVYSGIEHIYFPDEALWKSLDDSKSVTRIYRKSSILIYEIIE